MRRIRRVIGFVVQLLWRRGYDYGVFNDDGLISGPYSTRDSAETNRAGQLELEVLPVCPKHPDQAAYACEPCNTAT